MPINGTSEQVRRFSDFLKRSLNDPELSIEIRNGVFNGPDYVLEGTLADDSWQMEIELRSEQPTIHAVEQILDRKLRVERTRNLVLIAPFISQSVQRRLVEQNVSFWDATGNAWISIRSPRILIRTDGAIKNPDRAVTRRSQSTLKGKSAARVVLSFFETPAPASLRAIADSAEVGLGTVSRTTDLLRREGILKENDEGRTVLGSRRGLMARWIEDYNFSVTNHAKRYVATLTSDVTVQRLRADGYTYALTGIAAQKLLLTSSTFSVYPSTETWAYIDATDAGLETLGLVPVKRGGDFVVAKGASSDGLRNRTTVSGVSIAERWRIVADLMSNPGREQSAGKQLFEQLLAAVDDSEGQGNW